METTEPTDAVLEAVPNVAEGRDEQTIERISRAFRTHGSRLLDIHSDPDHQRSVFTLIGRPQSLADTLLAAARETIELVDMGGYAGAHPCIGSLDVLPVVYLEPAQRELARDEALSVANSIASELAVPVFLYGDLANDPERSERAFFRGGGTAALAERLDAGELAPDFGPARLHPTAGATLVGTRPPLVAFNIDLEGAKLDVARQIAATIREAGGGLPGVRAIGLQLERQGRVQVSTNVHDPFRVSLGDVVDAVSEQARPLGADVSQAEIVGLAPAAALEGLASDLLRNFDPQRHILENQLEGHGKFEAQTT